MVKQHGKGVSAGFSSFGGIGFVGLVKYDTVSNHSAAVDRRYSADDKRGKGQVTGRGPGEFPGPFCFLGSCGRGEKWGIVPDKTQGVPVGPKG